MQTTSLLLVSPSLQSALSLLTQGAGNASERALQALEAIRASGALPNDDDLNSVRQLISEGSLKEARVCLCYFAAQLTEQRSNELSQAVAAVLGVKLAHRALYGHRAVPRLTLQDYEKFPVLVERVGEDPPVAEALTSGNYLLIGGTAPVVTFLYERTREERNRPPSALHRIRFEDGDYFLNGRPLSHEQEVEADGSRYRIRLPEGFVLEQISGEIMDQTTGESLAALLRDHGLASRADEVDALLKSPMRLDALLRQIEGDIPVAGGLREKVRELAIHQSFQSLKSKYFPTAKDCEALSLFNSLANEVAHAGSSEEILELLGRTPSPWILLMLSPIRDHVKGYLPLSAVPEAFGVRERMSDFKAAPAPRPQEDPFILNVLGISPKEFASRSWQHIVVSGRLRAELEPFRRFVAKKLDLDGLFSHALEVGEGAEELDLRPGQTANAMYDRYKAKAANSTVTPSVPGATNRLLQDLAIATVAGPSNGYWMYGGSTPRKRFEGRIYLSLKHREAFAIWSYLNRVLGEELHERGVTTQFKMAVRREGMRRSDSGVVYFYAANQREIYDAAVRMSAEHPEFFKEGRPVFTDPLVGPDGRDLTGLSFGQHPRLSWYSFGSLRTTALGSGIALARLILSSGRSPDWEEFLQIFALCLDRYDVDIEDPAFNKGGRADLASLSSLCKNIPGSP